VPTASSNASSSSASGSDRLFGHRGAGSPLIGRVTEVTERLRHRAAPNSWSFLFGVIVSASLVVLVVTGLALMLLYDPSSTLVSYQGSYSLLRGVEVSRAFASTLHISLDVPGGLLLRQVHHWAALVLPAALLLQLASLFFTGGFRRPRHWAWVLLVGVLILSLVSGWSGYALPDDSLSGTGLRIVQGVTLGIPVIGTWLARVLFGGEFPGRVIENLYLVHLAAPALLVVLVVLRIRLSWHTLPAQFPGPGRSEDTVVGLPVWPAAAVRAAGLFFLTIGVLLLMAGLLVISPSWQYGPSSPANAFAGSQPDWYTAFLDGALRLVPPGWELVWWGRTWTLAILVPLVVIGLFFAVLTAYPFLESWKTRDRHDHQLLQRPRDTPARTGVGAAGVTFYGALWAAGSADLMATQFRVSFEGVIWALRALVVLGPVVAYLLTRRVCLALQLADRDQLLHGSASGRIDRDANGGYTEPHQPLDARRRWMLQAAAQHRPRPVLGDGAEQRASTPPSTKGLVEPGNGPPRALR
jgi:ubiquinol-cytochrome c reductase cytochrome b subunit